MVSGSFAYKSPLLFADARAYVVRDDDIPLFGIRLNILTNTAAIGEYPVLFMAPICSRDAGSGVFKTFYSKEKSRHFKYSSQMRILQEGVSDG